VPLSVTCMVHIPVSYPLLIFVTLILLRKRDTVIVKLSIA